MAQLINEAKRMQFLAGVINESQLDEADTSIIGGMAKNLYLYLSKMKPNSPVDVNGAPLKNVDGDVITRDKKVKMSYQNLKLAKQGKAKALGNTGGEEVTINSTPGMVHALGFVKKEEAEAALKYILDKYPNQFKGLYGKPEVYTNKMDHEWAKHYAPTYSFALVMKDDKEIAKTQSAKPSTQVAQAAESLDIDSIVNEALKSIKEVAPAAPAPAPKQTADVAGLTKMIQSNTSLMNKLKTVNNGQEVTETIAFILNNINPKATGVNKSKLKSIIDQRFQ